MHTLRGGLPNVTFYPLPETPKTPEPREAVEPQETSKGLERSNSSAAKAAREYRLSGNGRSVFDGPLVCSIEPGANGAFEAETFRFTVSSPVVHACCLAAGLSHNTLTSGIAGTSIPMNHFELCVCCTLLKQKKNSEQSCMSSKTYHKDK